MLVLIKIRAKKRYSLDLSCDNSALKTKEDCTIERAKWAWQRYRYSLRRKFKDESAYIAYSRIMLQEGPLSLQ